MVAPQLRCLTCHLLPLLCLFDSLKVFFIFLPLVCVLIFLAFMDQIEGGGGGGEIIQAISISGDIYIYI